MKKYVFDFDGVICDSTPECYVTSYIAWQVMNSYPVKINIKFNEEKIYKKFSKFRPFIKGGGEYFIFYYFESNKIKKNYYNYNIFKKKLKTDINTYSKIFYNERKKLMKKNLNKWLNLNYIFPDVLKTLKTLNNNNKLLISTMKDKKSVLSILKKNNLLLKKNNILDQFEIKDKSESLNIFMKKFKLKKNDIYFFDDNVNHILKPKREGFNVYLTTWGFSTKEFKQIAKKNDISILNNIKKFNFT